MKRRLSWRVIGGFIASVLLLSLVIPFVSADRYRGSIHAALENALGRRVEIGELRFRLLPEPGFTASNVTIGEDPAIGAEPIAYVTTLRAVPSVRSLFGGPLQFSSVDLEDTSLNLTRVDRHPGEVVWNFSGLLRPKLLRTFPSVHLRGGRINFKFDDTKSIFYLLNTDVDLWPPNSSDGPWTLRVHGEPARTDRPARGFGSFVARGQWLERENKVTLDVNLEKSELGDMLTLFRGHESGVEGTVSGVAHLAGPLNRVLISGGASFSNLHGWDQTPPGGSAWPLRIGGTIDVPGQTIDLVATVPGEQSPASVRYKVSDYLRRPHWGVMVNLHKFPVAPVGAIARNMGWQIPADFRLEGVADGAIGYSMPEGMPRMEGDLQISAATLAAGGAPPLRVPAADLRFAGSAVTLNPSTILNETNQAATLEGAWDYLSRELRVSLTSTGMAIGSVKNQIALAGLPLLSQATGGVWKGALRYSSESSGWQGEVHLSDADIPFEAFSAPLHVVDADATLFPGGVSMKRVLVSIGGMEAQGEYSWDPGALRPHHFRLNVPKASGSELEKLLMPALHRGNFFTYAFNFGRVPQPDWLIGMRADGTLTAGVLDLNGVEFTKVRTRVIWEGADVHLSGVQSQVGSAQYSGTATIHLEQRQPVYEVDGRMRGMPWKSGTLDAAGSLSTSGTGSDLMQHMHAQGTFQGTALDLSPLDSWDSAAGLFDWTWEGRTPRLKLTQLVMKNGGETFTGGAETLDDGQVVLRLSDGARHIQAPAANLRGER